MFVEAIKRGFSNYVNFSGRAPRWEYWYWVLFVVIVSIVSGIIDRFVFVSDMYEGGFSPVNTIVWLALLLPSISIGARRLHDLDKSGWWLLLSLGIWGTVFWKGTAGPNRFGPDPLASNP